MAAAAARAPTALRAFAYAGIDLSTFNVLKVVARSQGRGYGGGQIGVAFLPPGPQELVRTFNMAF